MFFLFAIKQNPTPQLNVLSISMSVIFLFLSHLNMKGIFIFDKSIFAVKLYGTDLTIFSVIPPPVILAAELIKLLLTNFKISLV